MPPYRTPGGTGPVLSTAVLSDDGSHRYTLTRTWDDTLPGVTWVMLNPSTADAHSDDPTIRRCLGFARAWGFGRLDVVNLFAYRATDPDELLRVPHDVAVGFDNDRHIIAHVRLAEPVPYVVRDGRPVGNILVCAWGGHRLARKRGRRVSTLLVRHGAFTHRVGEPTQTGAPRHPLYLPGNLQPSLFLSP